MNGRRKMLISVMCGFVILMIGMLIWDGDLMKARYDISKEKYDDEKEVMSEIQFQLIRAGIQAGSSHNMQPWKIRIHDKRSFSLYADMEKTLPVIDPEHKQLLMSQGTFIGSVKKAAKESGVELQVTYHTLNMSEDFPSIATFTILKDEKTKIDAVTSATERALSNEAAFDIEKTTELISNILPYYEVIWVEGEDSERFQDYLRKGTSIEAENQQAMEELLHIFRFTKWEKNKYRYGLSLNTMAPPARTFIEPIIGAASGWKSFGRSSITAFEQRMEKEKIYLVIALEGPKPLDYIQVGEAISFLSLDVEGYSPRPAVQLLEPLDGMKEVYNDMREKFGIKGEVLQIIGFTKKTGSYHESIRHQVSDLIME